MPSETSTSRADARRDLAMVIKLLKRAGVSQNTVARSAGYSPGYVTQLLGDRYPIERLTVSAISRLVRSANSRARSARGALVASDVEELDRLLAALTSDYVRTMAEVYGMDGEVLDDREAAQYQDTEADRRLLEDIDGHRNYGVVLVSGAPGQGKTWTLANLARDATSTHEVIWIDFERLEREEDRRRPAHLQMGRDLRQAQQRYFWELARTIGLDVDIAALEDRERAGSAVDLTVRAIEAALLELDGVTASRIEATVAGLDRRLDASRLLGLDRRGATRRYLDAVRDPAPDAAEYTEYREEDLAEDISLLWCLVDAAALIEAPGAHDEPRKLLILVDSPDRHDDLGPLIQMVRAIATLIRRFNPECRNAMVVMSKTVSVTPSPMASSAVRRWYPLEPFSREDARALVAVLQEHGWFRGGAFATEEARAELVESCRILCGFNRRASCMYLDQCHRMSHVIEPEAYLGLGEHADDRVPRWIEAWAQRAVRALTLRPELRDDVRWWLDADGVDLPEGSALCTFVKDFGLIVEVHHRTQPGRDAEQFVPLLQQAVCARMRSLLDQEAPR